MPLLAIEIDLESFFDINLITFTILGFTFSVIVTFILTMVLRPLSAHAKVKKGLKPEKMNLVYLRLIIYVLAEFIAFIIDVFLVIFGKNYNVPFFTIAIFLIVIIYKLIFVLFRSYKDLGFNDKGLIKSAKLVTKVIKDKTLDAFNDLDANLDEDEDV